MRRALLRRLPALTRFYYGAISPSNIDELTYAELLEYVHQMDDAVAAASRAQRG